MRRVTGTIGPDPDGAGTGNPHLAVRNVYDLAGQLIRQESGTLATLQAETVAPSAWSGFTILRTAETSYDLLGRKTRESLREGAAGTVRTLTQYSYDSFGRLECTAVRMNPALFASPPASACTLGTQGSEGPDRITRAVYDAAGQRLQLRAGVGSAEEGAEASWAYNADGQVTTVVDGNGNRATLSYDGHGRQTRWTFPSETRPGAFNDSTPATALATAGSVNAADYEGYAYDPAGNRTTLRKRDGSTFTYAYDALNRMTVKEVPERDGLSPMWTRDVYYAYDLGNRMTDARFDAIGGEGVVNAYDGLGRMISSRTSMAGTNRTLTYQYDAAGNRIGIVHPDGNWFGMVYDAMGRPTYLHSNWTAGIAYAYRNAAGDVAASARNNVPVNYGYDSVQRLTSISHETVGSCCVRWLFTRNPAGGLAAETRENYGPGQGQADSYAWAGHYAVNRNYTTDGLNRYSAAGLATFLYDDNGNLTSDGGRQYDYDRENRLIWASGSPTTALVYDPLGRLFQVTHGGVSTQFLYDGDAMVAEYDGAGALVARHAHWPGADVPMVSYAGTDLSQPTQLLSDTRGSIVTLANNSGALTGINTYDEYGIPAATNAGRFQYTGQIWLAELGMYYYKARVYSPYLGRFMQTDPIGYEDQMNLYAYVRNDPVNHVDPTGTTCDEVPSGYDCHIDDPGELNPEELAAQNAAYTEGVNRLMRNPDRKVSVTVGGIEMEATQGEIANGLIRAEVVVSSDPVGQGAHTLGGGLTPGQGTEDGRAIIVLFPHGQQMPGLREDFQQQERVFRFIHEGVHTLPQERVFRDVPNFNRMHQPQYRRVVRNLYGQ